MSSYEIAANDRMINVCPTCKGEVLRWLSSGVWYCFGCEEHTKTLETVVVKGGGTASLNGKTIHTIHLPTDYGSMHTFEQFTEYLEE